MAHPSARLSARRRALVNVLGVIFFIFPMCGFLVWTAWDYVAASWTIGEVSRNAGGLPYPFIPLLKTVLIVMPVAMAAQGASMMARSIIVFRRS